MAENEPVWQAPVVQVLLGGGIILAIDALVVAVLVVTSTRWDLLMIAAVSIGFLQWLYVFPIAHRVRQTHYLMARGMTIAAIVLTVVNATCCFLLGQVMRTLPGLR
jgi:hypothetical protein